jgi:drug/metabolite transporter (DMT)-like permease
MPSPTNKPFAVSLAILASILWASYFPFVLYFSSGQYGILLAMPFLFGGLPFFALTLIGSRAAARKSIALMANPTMIICAVLLVALQLDVILSTEWAGAVPTSLFSLLGDIAMIPLMNYAIFGEGGERLRYPLFGTGVVVAGIGAATVVLGGNSSLGLSWAWLITLPIPFLVGGYYLEVARLTNTEPIDCTVSSITLLAFIMSFAGAFLVLGTGWIAAESFSVGEYGLLALIGLTTFFLGPWAFFVASRRLTVVIPAVINATIPIFTTVFVVVLFHYSLNFAIYVGVPLAFVGSAFALLDPPTKVARATSRS